MRTCNKRMFVVLAAMTAMLVISIPASAAIIVNGDFEDGNKYAKPPGWTVGNETNGTIMLDSVAHEGSGSLKMNRTSGSTQIYVYQDIDVTPNEDYTFSFWGRLTTTSTQDNIQWNRLDMDIKDIATDELIGRLRIKQDVDGGGVWVFKEGTFNSGERTQVRVVLGNSTSWRGNSLDGWIDDVTVVPEPTTLGMVALGLGGFLARRRRS